MPDTTQITLALTPSGPVSSANFATKTLEVPELAAGQFLVSVAYLSIDPTIRGWMAFDTYLPKIAEGEVIRSLGAGEIVESRNPKYPVGARVTGVTGWQSQAVMTTGSRIPDGVSYADALSVLGMTGLTAYIGLEDIGKPQAGETVVISGAAGAVGSIAGQIAKAKGARVIGIAGTDEKCRWVTQDLGFDECVNYRSQSVSKSLREVCPNGIDVYFDNVGGEILNAVLGQINDNARIAMCGAISGYDTGNLPLGPANLVNVIPRRALIKGFIILDHYGRAREGAMALGGLMQAGKLQSKVDIRDGLDQAPAALQDLFTGGNVGKTLIRL